MSIAAGTVSVDASGNVTGSGMSIAIYNAVVAQLLSTLPASAGATSIIAWKQGQASLAAAIAAGIVPYLTTNVVIAPGTFTDSALSTITGFGRFT